MGILPMIFERVCFGKKTGQEYFEREALRLRSGDLLRECGPRSGHVETFRSGRFYEGSWAIYT